MRENRLPKPGDARYNRYRWTVVIMLWLICVFNYADRQAIASVDKMLVKEFGFSDGDLGMIKSAFMVVYALSAPFAGHVGDMFARKWIIILGLYVWSAVTGFTAVCHKLAGFVFVRGAEGLGETFYFPASMSMVSDYHATSTRSRAMGLHQTGVYVGTVVGGAFAGWMGMHYGWRLPFIILGCGGILLGIALAAYIREPEREEAERFEAGGRADAPAPRDRSQFKRDASVYLGVIAAAGLATFILSQAGMQQIMWLGGGGVVLLYVLTSFIRWNRTPSSVLLLLGFVGANFVAMQFIMWAQTFLVRKFNLNPAQAGLYGTVFIQVGSMVGATLGGAIADAWRKRIAGGRMLTQCLGLLMGAPLIYLFSRTTDFTTMCVVMAAYGICKGIYDAGIWASLFDVVPAARRGAAVGLMNTAGWLAGAYGVLLMGQFTDQFVKAHSGGSKAEAIVMPLKVQAMSDGFQHLTVMYVGTAVLLIIAGVFLARRDTLLVGPSTDRPAVH